MTALNKAVVKYLAEIGREGGKVGGKATTRAKQIAARKNGAKGGRPKTNGRPKGKRVKA